MYNKRGLSTIVATVLIILLVIAGVTLVWSPVRKLITEQSEELESSCLLANPRIIKACMGGIGNVDLLVTISNGVGELDNVQIIYGDDADNLIETNTPSPAVPIGMNQIQTITISSATGTPESIRIAAIIGRETCVAGSISTVASSCI